MMPLVSMVDQEVMFGTPVIRSRLCLQTRAARYDLTTHDL